jgi:predicted dehydrogenase
MVIVGAGERGVAYAGYADLSPDKAQVVAVAEPRSSFLGRIADAHGVPEAARLDGWRSLAALPRVADVAVIATPDAEHAEAAIALAGQGYHLLLEKPMATTEADCYRIIAAVEEAGIQMAVCHVLRFTPVTQLIKALVDGGAIGRLVSIQRLEPVGYWHQAHSFVRGNWRRTDESTFMLLAKSCHDLDWIRYIADSPCVAISSFGGLSHFRVEDKPEGAGDRCLDCEVEPDCAYSAKRLYLGRVREGHTGWPVSVLSATPTESTIEAALRSGPYGRCVYTCDNDVVDHQVVNMQFGAGQTASFTMTAFTGLGARRTRLFGTKGELESTGETVRVYSFGTDEWQEHSPAPLPDAMRGHGGGDFGLMDHFIDGIRSAEGGEMRTSPREILESHLMAFAAERSRLEGRTVRLCSG